MKFRVIKCPWKKGKYHLFNYLLGPGAIPPLFGFGDYKFQLLVHYKDELVNGFSLFVNVVTLM